MKKFAYNFLFASAFIPLLLKAKYLFSAWKTSPLDSLDFIFWLAIPFSAILCQIAASVANIHPNPKKKNRVWGAASIIFLVASFAFLYSTHLNTASVVVAILIAAAAIFLRFGWDILSVQIPTFCVAAAGIPSIAYWTDYYFEIGLSTPPQFFFYKASCAAAISLFWTFAFTIRGKVPSISSTLFCVALCLAMIIGLVNKESLTPSLPLNVNIDKFQAEDWVSKDEPLTIYDKKFFSNNANVQRRMYFNSDSQVGLLRVSNGSEADLHPIGICLKSSGFRITSSEQQYIKIRDKEAQINVIEAEKNGSKITFYCWFSDDKSSTGDFARVRLRIKKHEFPTQYRLMTPQSGIHAKKRLNDMLENFAQ